MRERGCGGRVARDRREDVAGQAEEEGRAQGGLGRGRGRDLQDEREEGVCGVEVVVQRRKCRGGMRPWGCAVC